VIDMLAVNGWGVNIWYSEEGTGWAVTFGTARRRLGGLRPASVISLDVLFHSLLQLQANGIL